MFAPLILAATPYVYVGRLTSSSAILAWGTAESGGSANTIGRGATPMGEAEVEIGGKVHETAKAWIDVEGLQADTSYPYTVRVKGKDIGHGTLRTWPVETRHLRFLVIGDYGNGSAGQYSIAKAMEQRFAADRASDADSPPRMILTTGDNIYGLPLGVIAFNSGDRDRHWRTRFFEPYQNLLHSLPFYPTLGNHDGNQSENKGDLAVYLDNFFFPTDPPSRYYTCSIGEFEDKPFADFFALDSTDNEGSAYGKDSAQFKWMQTALEKSRARWKIVYFHHPPYTAGPLHGASLKALQHWVDLFERTGVQMVFNGHEHNFQYARHDGISYFVTGAGGELRGGDVAGSLAQAGIEAYASQRHFLDVELDDKAASIGVWDSTGEVHPLDQNHKPVATPFRVNVNRSQ